MKNLVLLGGIVLCLVSLQLTAQVKAPLNEWPAEKPLLFTDLPEKCSISLVTIEKIFSGTSQGSAKIPIDNNRAIEAIIVERVKRSADLTTINMRLPQYHGALFTISRLAAVNQPLIYTGRVMHIEYGDLLQLRQENDKLFFVKEKQSTILVE